jgi:hypothetical protein
MFETFRFVASWAADVALLSDLPIHWHYVSQFAANWST